MPPNVSIFDIFREPLYLESIGASLGLGINSMRKRQLPSKDYSVSEWLYAVSNSRKGAGTLASAMMHGIYGGDIDKLSARCVLDRVYWGWYLPNPGLSARPMPVAEQALLDTLGQDKQIQKMALEPRSVLVDFGDKGMESLPQALSAALREQPNVTIETGEAVQDVVYNKANQQVHVRYLPHMVWSMSLTVYDRLSVPTPRTSPSTTPTYTTRSSQHYLHRILPVSQETNSPHSQQHTPYPS
jgi:protoporphyrinogen/coproporphyrinogen III oxidase